MFDYYRSDSINCILDLVKFSGKQKLLQLHMTAVWYLYYCIITGSRMLCFWMAMMQLGNSI